MTVLIKKKVLKNIFVLLAIWCLVFAVIDSSNKLRRANNKSCGREREGTRSLSLEFFAPSLSLALLLCCSLTSFVFYTRELFCFPLSRYLRLLIAFYRRLFCFVIALWFLYRLLILSLCLLPLVLSLRFCY